MKARCLWSGHIRISLVTIPVRVYSAINSGEKIAFHHLHKGCHQRVRQKLVCPVHGEVAREALVKGFEHAKNQFVVVEECDLANLRLETSRTIDLLQFIKFDELDPLFLDSAYYVGADGPVGSQGVTVLGRALERTGRIGIGQIVLRGQESVVALKPLANGFVLFTLRSPAEVRPPCTVLGNDSAQPLLDEAHLSLAQTLIESKSVPFDPARFVDHYQTAVRELIRAKISGANLLVVPQPECPALSLVEALRQSLAQTSVPSKNGSNNGVQDKSTRVNGRLPHRKGRSRQTATINNHRVA